MSCPYTYSEKHLASTVSGILRQRATRQPEQLAYIFLVDGETEERSLTYAELDRQARAIGALLQDLGATGGHALLLYPPGLEYIAAFFGCLYAGMVAVPSYPPRLNRPDSRLKSIIADAQATVALTTMQILSNIERRFAHTPDLKALHWLATDDLGDELAEEWDDPVATSDTLAFLQYTSGSTASPKGVMVSHGNLLHNSALIHQCFGHTPDSRGVIWLPPYHDMGLIGGILQPLYGGFPVVLMSPVAFLQQPICWLQAISRYQASTSGGPNFAYDLCVRKITPEQRATLDLSSWDVAFSGAEPVRQETMARFVEAFAPCGFRREVFYPCYGLAEATLIVSGGQKAAPPIVQRFETSALARKQVVQTSPGSSGVPLVGCGQTMPSQKIVIVDPESLTQCPPDHVGEIWVTGPGVAQGYWNQSEETEQTFQAHLADTSEGPFLRTGDLGFLKDGELFITGRIKDLIIIRGRNHYPQDIELAVEQSHSALRQGCGAAFSIDVDGKEQLVVIQEVKRTHRNANIDEVAWAVRRAVTEEHGLQVYAIVLIRPMSIPKTSSGKVQRHLCRARFLEDSLKVVGSSILDTLSADAQIGQFQGESFVRRALAAVNEPKARHSLLTLYLQEQTARVLHLSPSQVDTQQPLSALGLDSLMAVELKHAVETSLGVVLSMVDFLQELSISQLASRVLAELATPSATPLAPLASVQGVTGESPLSHGQRAMWFLQQLTPESAAYNIANAAQIRGELDIPALRRAFQTLVDRHASLRTTFSALHGEPVQCIQDQVKVYFRVEDASTWDKGVST